MKFLIPYLKRLQFKWVVVANAVLLLIAQLSQFYLQQQPAEERTTVIIRILQSNNSSMFWYLIAGIDFFCITVTRKSSRGIRGSSWGRSGFRCRCGCSAC